MRLFRVTLIPPLVRVCASREAFPLILCCPLALLFRRLVRLRLRVLRLRLVPMRAVRPIVLSTFALRVKAPLVQLAPRKPLAPQVPVPRPIIPLPAQFSPRLHEERDLFIHFLVSLWLRSSWLDSIVARTPVIREPAQTGSTPRDRRQETKDPTSLEDKISFSVGTHPSQNLTKSDST